MGSLKDRPRAMILAAGFGSRLGELSQARPKPMLPVCGAPLVRWAALWLRAQGVDEIVINLHHLGEQIEAELGDGSSLGLKIQYSRETEILGTGGGLRQARDLLDPGDGRPILVLNGKVIFDLELERLVARHRSGGGEATMVVRPDAEGIWGAGLALGADGLMSTFLDEDREGGGDSQKVMFTGIHLFEPSFLDRVPSEGMQCVVRTAYRDLFRGAGIQAHLHEGYWWEHSTVERYLKGIENVLSGRVDLPFAEAPICGVDPRAHVDASAEIEGPVWIGPDASIGAGAKVGPFAQIGAGAQIEAGAQLARCAVWDGVRVRGRLERAVAVSDRG